MWTSLQSYMLSRALHAHAGLGKPKDKEWIHILLSFLNTWLDSVGTPLTLEDETVNNICNLVQGMRSAVEALESGKLRLRLRESISNKFAYIPDVTCPDHSAMSIWVPNIAIIAETEDGSFLEAKIRNFLPCVSDVANARLF
jgi:trafficking protein particle complex subunit 10